MVYESSKNDFYYTAAVSALTYYILVDDSVIYAGKAVNPFGNVKINVAQRIRDYLYSSMPDFREYDGEVAHHPEQMRVFSLMDGDYNVLETYTVLLEYTGKWDGDYGFLAEPINGHADARQKVFLSYLTQYPTEGFFFVVPDTYLVPFDSSAETVTLQVVTNMTGVTFSTSGGTAGYNMELTDTGFTFTTLPNTGETPIFEDVYFYSEGGDLIFVVHLTQDYGVSDTFGADAYNVPPLGCTEFAYVTYDGNTSSSLTSGHAAYLAARKDGSKSSLMVSPGNNPALRIAYNYTDYEQDGVFYGHTRNIWDWKTTTVTQNEFCVQGFNGGLIFHGGYGSDTPYSGASNVEYMWLGFINGAVNSYGGNGVQYGNVVGLPNLKEIIFRGAYSGETITYDNGLIFGNGFCNNVPNLERVIMPDYTYAKDVYSEQWSSYGCREIHNTFNNCTSLRYVKLADDLIYVTGFDGCTSLHTIIGKGLKNVPDFGVNKPYNLKKLYLGGLSVNEFKSECENCWQHNKYLGLRESLHELNGTYLPFVTLKDGIVKLKYDAEGNCSLDE